MYIYIIIYITSKYINIYIFIFIFTEHVTCRVEDRTIDV